MHKGTKDRWSDLDMRAKRNVKTYNSGDSLVVTHLTTNPPVTSLSTAERTGSAIFSNLWSYVEEMETRRQHHPGQSYVSI
jgi:hypothetical protein